MDTKTQIYFLKIDHPHHPYKYDCLGDIRPLLPLLSPKHHQSKQASQPSRQKIMNYKSAANNIVNLFQLSPSTAASTSRTSIFGNLGDSPVYVYKPFFEIIPDSWDNSDNRCINQTPTTTTTKAKKRKPLPPANYPCLPTNTLPSQPASFPPDYMQQELSLWMNTYNPYVRSENNICRENKITVNYDKLGSTAPSA